ncbi:MAG: HAMP domain-containing histidine kinase [Lachnospiraceae bacterium]|nr:HAMP domain-containing histidine kinase [Lachnospiraceae bacterium]
MKIRKSIFTKLIGSFLLYAVLIIITFVVCVLIEALIISEGKITKISPESMIDERGNVTNIEIAQNLGGWIEELDADNKVIQVYGEKLTSNRQYSNDEILKMCSSFSDTEYIGIFISASEDTRRFLCVYDRDMIKADGTIILNDIGRYGTIDIFPLFFVFCFLEIIFISMYLKKKIKKPLEEISVGMERLKTGDSSTRLEIKTEAEFEEIVNTFNMMAEQLEKEKLEKEQMTQKKNQMLLELSHDIKTPIATIKSCANALEEGLVPEEKVPEYYHIIEAKADRVQALSEDMFVMLKMDNPGYHPQLEKVDMCEYLRKLCTEYYDEITEKGLEFDVEIPEERLERMLDTNLFARVIGNLLTNAGKYNQTGKSVGVRLFQEKEHMVLEVRDDGEAIDKTFAEQMFQAFSRADSARKTDGGTGLGLAISKIIVEKHGGTLEYQWENEVNVFRVIL